MEFEKSAIQKDIEYLEELIAEEVVIAPDWRIVKALRPLLKSCSSRTYRGQMMIETLAGNPGSIQYKVTDGWCGLVVETFTEGEADTQSCVALLPDIKRFIKLEGTQPMQNTIQADDFPPVCSYTSLVHVEHATKLVGPEIVARLMKAMGAVLDAVDANLPHRIEISMGAGLSGIILTAKNVPEGFEMAGVVMPLRSA